MGGGGGGGGYLYKKIVTQAKCWKKQIGAFTTKLMVFMQDDYYLLEVYTTMRTTHENVAKNGRGHFIPPKIL